MNHKKMKIFFFILIGILIIQSAYTQIDNSMIKIQGGTFTMGSPQTEFGRNHANEGPEHQVTLNSFYISKYEITQEEYEAIMGVNPSHHRGVNLPVEMISWFDAIEYCNKRSEKEGLTPVYTITGTGNGRNVVWNREANGYRLPTEAEWEYACRAGTQTPYNVENLGDGAWFHGNSRVENTTNRITYPVGQKQPNAWGLYDMHGNVIEWCWDWLDNYTAGPKVNPTGPATGVRRVFRGGSFNFEDRNSRSAYRFGTPPGLRLQYTGFRVARNE